MPILVSVLRGRLRSLAWSSAKEGERDPGLKRPRRRTRDASFNHLVGAGQQSRRHLDAERLSSPEVDGKLEFGRLLNRQVSRLGAFQDAIDIERRLAKLTGRIDAVTQTPVPSRHTSGRAH